MPAEVLFAGGRGESFYGISGSAVEGTTVGRFDSAYADCFLVIGRSDVVGHDLFTETANVLTPTSVVAGEVLWAHWEAYISNSPATGGGGNIIVLRNSAGVDWVAVRCVTSNSTTFGIYYNSTPGGTATWVLTGSTYSFGAGLFTLDLKFTIGSPHTVELFLNGSSILTGSFTDAGLTNIGKVKYSGNEQSSGNGISQVMVTRDIPTIGGKVKTARATANGANTAWSGAFTDVNEVVGSDATYAYSTTAGQKESHAMTDVTVPSGMEIKSVFHWMRAKNDGSSPTNIKSLLRSGGVDYSTGNLSGIGLGYASVGARYNTDPGTGINWTQSGWNAIEAGYESAA